MQNKFLITFVLTALITLVVPGSAYAEVSVHLEGFYNEFFFTFDKPRGTVPSYDIERDIMFRNLDPNNSVAISNLAASISDIEGFTVTLGATSLTVLPDDTGSIDAVFHASKDMEEGLHKGKLSITGTSDAGSISFTTNIRVQITWPEPVLNATWDENDWGLIKAGSNLTRNLIINETMGYKPINDTQLILVEFGPANLSYTKNLGTLAPHSTNAIPVDISVPIRGLTPSRYSVSPFISANGTVTIEVEDASYEIPYPELVLKNTNLDFGSITFDPDKDSAMRQVIISEVGGYTPIEGLNISLVSGEKGWIEFPEIDYIPPGTSVPVKFSLRLPPEASLGVKEWRYTMTTRFAGRNTIIGRVRVYFPGIEDAIEDLNIIQLTLNTTGLEKELLDNTMLLLESARGETELRDIAMVMSVYSGARSLINLLNELKTVGEMDLERAGAIVVLSNNALNRIKIGNENLDKPQLKQFSEITFSIGEEIWRRNAETTVELIANRAKANKDSNYRAAALYYKRGAEIYTLLGDPLGEEYDIHRQQLENLYRDSLERAVDLRIAAEDDLESARGKMLRLADFYFLVNPFHYEDVSTSYSSALEKYDESMQLFDVAGEKGDAKLISKEIEKITREQRIFKNAFVAYGMFWVALFTWFMIRISLGFQNFRRDEIDSHVGDVILLREKT